MRSPLERPASSSFPCFDPRRRSDGRYLPLLQRGQASEDVAQIGLRIETAAADAFDNAVKDGADFAGGGIAEEQIVLFPRRSRPRGSPTCCRGLFSSSL